MKEKERNRPRPGVRLMTIHASKGLEFKQVFLIAANEGRIPYQKAKTDKEIEEERRLFYVAMTRAKDFFEDLLCENKKRERSYSLPFCRRTIEKLTGCQSLC